ncbi:MAG: hypothetical protein PQ971_03180 [Methanobacterium sp.]
MIAIASFHPNNNKEQTKSTYIVDLSIVDQFKRNIKLKNKEIEEIIDRIGKKTPFTVWGAAAKGTTFINCLSEGVRAKIPFIIDKNTAKHGKYCAGTGHNIMLPTILKHRDDIKDIIVMNPNYLHEISTYLSIYERKFNLFTI